ncbi:SMI1/KNR4 family protein [Micromonospora musae]|uniref:SMI1/KNR4 family protein n=1 Tax=Micromonospora musae TaxID=1894970 RepID=UPI0033F90356
MLGLLLELTPTDYRQPVLDPTIVFDDSGPLEAPLTDETLHAVEAQLGHKLPIAYVDLARRHNGGSLARDAHPAPNRTSWAEDHVGIYTLAAIERTAQFSLCGGLGSAFWIAEWGYPDIGIYIADCPSAGHDMIALDYRSPGEPAVVHVDQKRNYHITLLAPNFETFVTGLVDESEYDVDD